MVACGHDTQRINWFQIFYKNYQQDRCEQDIKFVLCSQANNKSLGSKSHFFIFMYLPPPIDTFNNRGVASALPAFEELRENGRRGWDNILVFDILIDSVKHRVSAVSQQFSMRPQYHYGQASSFMLKLVCPTEIKIKLNCYVIWSSDG